MSETKSQSFTLIGPNKGKTMAVNGREFVEGHYEFHGTPQEIAGLTNLFSYYGALPSEEAELHEALNGESQEPSGDSGVGSTANDRGDASSNDVPLAEAIGTLDPDNDAHWTSNNLPSLEYLTDVVGKKVGRADVDAVADGFTRAKAKALKAG